VTLRGKVIVQESKLVANTQLLAYETERRDIGEDFALYFPYIGQKNDLKSTNDISELYQVCGDDGSFPCDKHEFFTNESGFEISVKVQFYLKAFAQLRIKEGGWLPSDPSYGVKIDNSDLVFAYGPNADSNVVLLGNKFGGSDDNCVYTLNNDGTTDTQVIEQNYDTQITLQPGEKLFLWYQIATFTREFNACGDDADGYSALMRLDTASFINIRAETLAANTPAKVWLIHEAFAKIAEVITGVKDCFRSNFFGAGNSQPHQYDTTGCQRYLSVTNGLNIRNIKQSDGTYYPLNLSFSQLYKILDSVFCMGMRFEYDQSDAKWYVRVEPRPYFYSSRTFLTLDNVSDIEIKADITNYHNEFEVGYQKWQLNNGQTNGLDEFNTKRNYSILNKNANSKLIALSGAIAGGYPIEFTRRQQYVIDTTKDFETDNDIFLICLNRIKVDTYEPGTISEANELFTNVSNLISPSTSYNLRISPIRNMYRWLRWLKASLPKNEFQKIRFTNGEGNYLMTSTHEGGWCEPLCEMDEHGDFVEDSNCFSSSERQLISPEAIGFEYPCDFPTFTLILAHANEAIRVNCSDDVFYKGYIDSFQFKPNGAEGGTAKFILTSTPSSGAAFSEGFSDGFDSVI
jgi:hypothetical protein